MCRRCCSRRNRAKRRRHRWRPARAGGGSWSSGARHGRHRSARHATLMERQLDPAAGYLLQKAVEERGIRSSPRRHETHPPARRRVQGIELGRWPDHSATLVVMAVGIRPNAGLAKEAGLAVNRGIVVDGPEWQTSDGDIMALGECAEVGAWSTASSRPFTKWRASPPPTSPRPPRRLRHSDTPTKIEGDGHQPLFGRRLRRCRRTRRDRTARCHRRIYKRLVLKTTASSVPCYGDTATELVHTTFEARHGYLRNARHLIFGQAYQGGFRWTLRGPLQPAG